MTPPRHVPRFALMALAAGLVLAAAGLLVAINEWLRRTEISLLDAPAQPPARVGAPFRLLSHDARQVTDRDFHGRRMLLVFSSLADEGRTAAALQVISQALASLGEAAEKYAPVLVTLDPDHDTPERLASWLSTHGASTGWTALTGPRADVFALAQSYHVALPEPATTRKGEPPSGALMLHLMDETGAYVSHRTLPNDPKVLSDWLRPNP